MPSIGDIANLLTASGIGAVLGGIASSLINIVGKRGSDRADIAERLTGSASAWIEKVEERNAELTGQNRNLREALVAVTNLLDKVIEDKYEDDPERQAELKAANDHAREVLF